MSAKPRQDDAKVPPKMQAIFEDITNLTDEVCQKHLNQEYAELARRMVAALCRKRPSPLLSGYSESWAAGVTYAMGQANFLFDRSQEPHMRADDLCRAMNTSKSTASTKANAIRKLLKIHHFDHKWMLPSRIDDSPVVWMIMVNGIYVDARDMPREIQKEAVEKGFIPYMPKPIVGRNVPDYSVQARDDLWDMYYDAMEYAAAEDFAYARDALLKIIAKDKTFVAAYISLIGVSGELGDDEGERKYTELAYQETLKHFPSWPEDFTWGVIEYRQYLRAICYKACWLSMEGKTDEADRLYRLLLQFTPNDNQGVRYLMAGMYAGVMPKQVDEMTHEGNDLQDWSKLENMLDEQNAIHHFWVESEL
jgi:tetratricopeptide (TPR) repeat protein